MQLAYGSGALGRDAGDWAVTAHFRGSAPKTLVTFQDPRPDSSPPPSPLPSCFPRAGKYELQLVAMCDSYVGVDRTVPITLKVSALTRAALDEREARNAKVKQWESDDEEEEEERKAKAKGGWMGQRQGPAARVVQMEMTRRQVQRK